MTGIGIDLCGVERFLKLKNDNHFLERIFTQNEIAYCSKKRRAEECFAARFAAKEAFMKAIGTGLAGKISFKDIEVCKDDSGAPYLELYNGSKEALNNTGCSKVHLSISHERNMAAAVVIIEK